MDICVKMPLIWGKSSVHYGQINRINKSALPLKKNHGQFTTIFSLNYNCNFPSSTCPSKGASATFQGTEFQSLIILHLKESMLHFSSKMTWTIS